MSASRSLPIATVRMALVCGAVHLLFSFSPATGHPTHDAQAAALDAAIASAPADAALFLRRGELRRARRDWDAALDDYRRARAIDPALDAADLGAGLALLGAGRFDAARVALGRFLARRPGHAAGLVARARALAGLGLHLAAAADYTRSFAAAGGGPPPRPEHYLERAAALEAAGDEHREAALKGLDEGIERLGPAVTLLLAAIDLEVSLARHDAALARLDALAAASSWKGSWLARRGEVCEAAGRRAAAARAYGDALAALGSLPPRRRGAAGVVALETKVREALARLAPDHAPGGGR